MGKGQSTEGFSETQTETLNRINSKVQLSGIRDEQQGNLNGMHSHWIFKGSVIFPFLHTKTANTHTLKMFSSLKPRH